MTLLYALLWLTISEHSKKTFFLGSFLTEVRSSGLQACNVSEKEDFCKYFFGIFEILENSFLSELFKKNICRGVFRSAVDEDCFHAIVLKKDSTTYILLDIYQSFRCSYFNIPLKNYLRRSSWNSWL